MDMKHRNTIIRIALIILLVIAAVYGVTRIKHAPPPANVVQSIDRHLTQAQYGSLVQQLQDAEKKLKDLAWNASREDRFRALTDVASQHYALGNLAQARSFYEEAAKIFPDNPVPWQELYTIDMDMHDYVAARDAISRAISLNPGSVSNWRSKITVEQTYLNVTGDALENLYREAIAKTNGFVDFIATYASILEDHGKLREARDQWQRAASAAPTNELYTLYKQALDRVDAKLKQQK